LQRVHGQVLEGKIGFVHIILKHGRWAIFREQDEHDYAFGLLDHKNGRKGCTRKCHVLSPNTYL
jgi:hypothetical protein